LVAMTWYMRYVYGEGGEKLHETEEALQNSDEEPQTSLAETEVNEVKRP